MKAVIYARYSSDNQREESIEGQIRECTAFAEKNGITILRHYIDRAFSAKTDNRPEFQNMIKDSGKRLFDMIIVWKLDRFARNRYDSARYKTALKKNGVKVVSATEVISDGAEGIILESVLEGYAEYYSADLSEKVVRGMTENALKSKYNGGTRPIGYLIDSDQCFQLDPLTAPFVREAFQRYDEGATMTQIRDWLNEQGVKNTRGQKMTYNSVQHLLNNRRYIGEYTYRDIVVPDGIPAIVPQDLFDRVQQKLAKNKKAPARHKAEDDYLLTTKLFCGYCGAYLCGESGTSHTGNVHHYYKCVSVKKKRTECHKKSVRKEWIEDLVVSETMRMVMDDKAIEAIVSMLMNLQDRENVNLPLYEQQLRETDTAIQNLLNAIQQGILTKSTKGRLEELEATKEELETKIAREKLAKPKVSAEFMTFWLHRFRKLDVRQKSHRKMLIDTFINAIFLYDDKMVITFNYKDGTDTITFDDLKTALAHQKTGSDLDCSTAPTSNLTTERWRNARTGTPVRAFFRVPPGPAIFGTGRVWYNLILTYSPICGKSWKNHERNHVEGKIKREDSCMLHIGCHLSSSDGFLAMGKTALSIGADVFQFFTRNPRGSRAKPVDPADAAALVQFLKDHRFPVVLAHAPYTLNPCSAKAETREFARETMADDLRRMEYVPGMLYNFHPGSHTKQGTETGIDQIAGALNEILTPGQTTTVLLETMAGKGTEVGRTFEEIAAILNKVRLSDKVGVCLDTCHIWDGGYDIVHDLDGVVEHFDRVIGLDRLRAVHLNDSRNGLGSHKDRHACIGEGHIGLDALVAVTNHPRLRQLPFFLETPNDLDGYRKEISLLRDHYKDGLP